MQTVLVVIHLLIVIALVGVVLIQRSEGGGLGVGGGSGFMTARGTKNALTRLTAILAICFFVTSLALVVLENISNPSSNILNRITTPGEGGSNSSILEQIGGTVPSAPTPSAVPESPIPQPFIEPNTTQDVIVPQTESSGNSESMVVPNAEPQSSADSASSANATSVENNVVEGNVTESQNGSVPQTAEPSN